MRISDWSSDVCSSDLPRALWMRSGEWKSSRLKLLPQGRHRVGLECGEPEKAKARALRAAFPHPVPFPRSRGKGDRVGGSRRSEEHTSELQSLMRISYAVFCLKKKKNTMIQDISN